MGDESLGDAGGRLHQLVRRYVERLPGVAGVAALILAANPDLRWDEVKDVLRASADRIDDNPHEYDENGHSKRYGYGRVNAAAAVRLPPNSAPKCFGRAELRDLPARADRAFD
jgi:subtilisin family serine protease